MKTALILVSLLLPVQLFSNIVSKTIYLNRGVYTAVDTNQFMMVSYNESTTFSAYNPVIRMSTNDTLALTIVNNDTVTHGFDIKNYSGVNSFINPGDSVLISFDPSQTGCWIYYDPATNGDFSFAGASGMIAVISPSDHAFFWTLKDFQSGYNDSIVSGATVDWNTYYPDYFTINGKSNPDINSDTLARVTGNVGDTIYIFIANTGHAAHSVHFHGYHSKIMQSSKFPSHVGRTKDTFPVYAMETIILRLVPDKAGEFPVHDHNLVAVTAGMVYPTGMLLTLLIF